MKQKQLSAANKKRLLAMYKARVPVDEIARRLGVSENTVYRLRRSSGMAPRMNGSPTPPPPRRTRARRVDLDSLTATSTTTTTPSPALEPPIAVAISTTRLLVEHRNFATMLAVRLAELSTELAAAYTMYARVARVDLHADGSHEAEDIRGLVGEYNRRVDTFKAMSILPTTEPAR